MTTLLISIGGFILLVIALVVLRARTGNRFEIKNSDIVIALIPIALWLFLTGKVQEFAFGDLKIVAAIKDASDSPVGPQVSTLSQLPVEAVRTDVKSDVGQIPRLIQNKSQALSFRLGHGGYWGPAITQYLDELTRYPFLKYILINNADGTFFGMADAREVAGSLRGVSGTLDAQAFANWLNGSRRTELRALPGFIAAEQGLRQDSDKRKALSLMDSLDVQTLPVVDARGVFAGIVDRSKLTASMILDIAARLETAK
jgi:hypothetical protein